MTKQLRRRQPHGGIEYLLSRILPPHASVDDAMRSVQCLFGGQALPERDWVAIRARVSRILESSAGDREAGGWRGERDARTPPSENPFADRSPLATRSVARSRDAPGVARQDPADTERGDSP